jgi:hypothetical protein
MYACITCARATPSILSGAVLGRERLSQLVRFYGDHPVYPADACVHCLRPATHEVELVKVGERPTFGVGQASGGCTVRKVKVPFCDECVALREAKSDRQILFERAAIASSILLALTVGVCTFVLLSSSGLGLYGVDASAAVWPWSGVQGTRTWVWGFLLGVLSALIVFGMMHLIVRPWSRRFRSPETKAVLGAVTIKDFDWETTTLKFADGEYAERFARANASAPF